MNYALTYAEEKLLKHGIKMIVDNPKRNLPVLIYIVDKLIRDPAQRKIFIDIKQYLQDEKNNWYCFIQKILTQTNPKVSERLAVSFFGNAIITGIPRQRELDAKIGASVPWAILIDPTEKCNLHCTGCWAGDYQRPSELDFVTLDRIITEAAELGIGFITYSGGEPMIRQHDIIKLAEKHPNQAFMFFSNGTLIDQSFVNDLVRIGNVVVTLSLEGFEQATDNRRGKGVFMKVMQAMDMMREAGVVFGASVTYNRNNVEELGSEAFVDMLIDKGVAFGWYFTYMPVGSDANVNMMATPEQRGWMHQRIREFRKTKPIFLMDFWNDGEYCNGCVAGGRRYFHITAAGDVEPCAFVHYSTCNIKNISLVEALQNPLFKAYQHRQPFNTNLLRPCPMIDNPQMLSDIVAESGAKWTQEHCTTTPEDFAARMTPYANAWAKIANQIWNEGQGHCSKNS